MTETEQIKSERRTEPLKETKYWVLATVLCYVVGMLGMYANGWFVILVLIGAATYIQSTFAISSIYEYTNSTYEFELAIAIIVAVLLPGILISWGLQARDIDTSNMTLKFTSMRKIHPFVLTLIQYSLAVLSCTLPLHSAAYSKRIKTLNDKKDGS